MSRLPGLWRLKKGDLILISGERWAKVLAVPFGFPWLSPCVIIESGWPIHCDHIVALEPAASPRERVDADRRR